MVTGSSRPAAAPGAAPAAATLRVEVVYAPAGAPADLTALELPADATLAQALHASGVLARNGLAADQLAVGVWGRRARLDTELRPGDRVELYRPLRCDPKEARRLRHRRQRSARPAERGPLREV